MVYKQHSGGTDYVVRRPVSPRWSGAVGIEENGAGLPAFVDDDQGMDRSEIVSPIEMLEADSLFLQSPLNEPRQLVAAQSAGVLAAGSHPRCRHQSRAGQPPALTLAATDANFAIGRRIAFHIDQIIDRRRAESEDIEAFHHGSGSACERRCGSAFQYSMGGNFPLLPRQKNQGHPRPRNGHG